MKALKIILIGCGQLGSRHLQAIAALPQVGEIFVVDSRSEALALGKERLSEISDQNPKARLNWSIALPAEAAGGDLCIVATQAKGRCALIKEVAEKLGYKRFLIEKIVAQSVEEYQDLLQFCKERGVQVWVNCKTRAYGIHQYIKSKLNPSQPFFLSDVGGNNGLANNGVHAADLFAFYDGGAEIQLVGTQVFPRLLPSKRGSGVFDLAGTLTGKSAKGGTFVVSFSEGAESPDTVYLSSTKGRFIVDHFKKFAWESTPETDWNWRPVHFDENFMVSHMTKAFVRDILSKGTCTLPTLAECFPAHEFILNALLPHFNQLRGRNDSYCPVT